MLLRFEHSGLEWSKNVQKCLTRVEIVQNCLKLSNFGSRFANFSVPISDGRYVVYSKNECCFGWNKVVYNRPKMFNKGRNCPKLSEVV